MAPPSPAAGPFAPRASAAGTARLSPPRALRVESSVTRFVVLFVVSAALTAALLAFLFLRPSSSPDGNPAGSLPSSTPVAAPEPPPAPAASPDTAAARPAPAPPRRPGPEATPPPAPTENAPAAAPVRGTLTVHADVAGAQVFVDRRFIGPAPATIDDLEPGPHRLNVSAEGYDGIGETIDVQAGPQEMTVRLREVRLNAALAVVHRHRIGSCTGRLVATPDGIRYETANKDDGFTAALADMETFDVNYQERNLRIRLRRGRDYNFTDPDGDADRLFVFHRDVDRARALLAKGYQPAAN